MKVIVFTCSTGGGHNSCARYIKEEFNKYNITCDVKDYMELVGPKASKIAENLYLDTTKGKGNVFKNIYKLGELYNKTGMKSPVYGLNRLVKNKLWQYLEDNEYDVAIGTHLFPCLALTEVKKEHPIFFINVATDYECIPFWDETNPDYFVIPSKLLKKRFIEKGIKEEVILPTGIPVASRFLKNTSKIDVPSNKDIILLTSGSMGFGNMKSVVLKLLEKIDAYVVVVCGTNEKLYHELSQITDEKLYVKGFITNMNSYMKASTVIVAKPGGLTTTEIAMMRKPLIHMMPIPGVETYNAKFFLENKMSKRASNEEEIISTIKEVIENKDIQKEMIENQQKIINDKSAEDLVKFVIEKKGE